MSTSLNATVAMLNAKGIPYKLAVSPFTGQMSAYAQNVGEAVVPSTATVDTNILVNKINNDLTAQGVDFQAGATYVGYIGMAFSKAYYPTVWVNTTTNVNGDLMALDKTGKLIGPAVIALIIIVAIATIAVSATYLLTYMWDNSLTYRDPNDGLYKTIIGKNNFLSIQNATYWYVCQKDGVGVGLKSQYPTLAQYQASPEYTSEQEYLKDHCASARDLLNPNDFVGTIILVAVILGGIYVVAKILPSIISKRSQT